MGRTRRPLPSTAVSGPKQRHKRASRQQYDRQAPVPLGFVAKPPVPKLKHHTYFEFVENKEKKKKLEFQVTSEKDPPPGFEFVPIGNPQLTTACKELSREKDAMIFIVSNSNEIHSTHLSHQIHRIGHHIRQAIVEEARASVTNMPHYVASLPDGEPEPIPESQEVYHAQADAAIRDLFPRIPNTDRQMIVEHAFTRGSTAKLEKPVGLSDDITLARRVQLAVLAHIRHTHTRYDELLRETTWQNARKVVEALCLDILVKWRGDEETGRDQLDEILREVVVISDSEDGSSDEESTDDTSVEESGDAGLVTTLDCEPQRVVYQTYQEPRESPRLAVRANVPTPQAPSGILRERHKAAHRTILAEKRAQRGFKRYRAWEQALKRNQDEPSLGLDSTRETYASHRLQQPLGYPEAARSSDPSFHPRIPGSTPDLNGHAQHHQSLNTSRLGALPQHDHRLDSIWHPREKVMSVVLDKSPRTSSHRQAFLSSRLEDMPVRSIEPVSPNARSSFVRTPPPSSQVLKDPSSLRSDLHHQSGPLPYLGDRNAVEDRIHLGRGDMSGRPRPRDSFLNASSVELRPLQVHYPRDSDIMHPINLGVPKPSPVFHYVARPHEPSSFSRTSQSRRIVVNAPRPGERSHPILMEDRGGFYERINAQSEYETRRIEVTEASPAAQEAWRNLEPYRVISREPGLRILPESRSMARIEVIQYPSIRARNTGARDSTTYDSFYPQRQHGASGQELRRDPRDIPDTSSWPVPRAAAVPPEGYWVIKRNHNQPVIPPHSPIWTSQQPEGRHPRHDSRSQHPFQPLNPQKVIVLD